MLILIIYFKRVECRKGNLNVDFMNGSIFKVILFSYHVEVKRLILNEFNE